MQFFMFRNLHNSVPHVVIMNVMSKLKLSACSLPIFGHAHVEHVQEGFLQ